MNDLGRSGFCKCGLFSDKVANTPPGRLSSEWPPKCDVCGEMAKLISFRDVSATVSSDRGGKSA